MNMARGDLADGFDVRDLLQMLFVNVRSIMVLGTIGLLIALGIGLNSKNSCRSTAIVMLSPPPSIENERDRESPGDAVALMRAIASSNATIAGVFRDANLEKPAQRPGTPLPTCLEMLADGQILYLTVIWDNPETSSAIAKSWADRVIAQINSQSFATKSGISSINESTLLQLKNDWINKNNEWSTLSAQQSGTNPAEHERRIEQVRREATDLENRFQNELKRRALYDYGIATDYHARVLEAPSVQTTTVTKPNVMRYSITGLVLGIIGGICLVLWQRISCNRITSAHDFQRNFNITPAAILPHFEGTTVSFQPVPNNSFAQSIASLQAAVQLKAEEGTLQKFAITVTSSSQNDGKSFVARSLVDAFRQTGRKVLLVSKQDAGNNTLDFLSIATVPDQLAQFVQSDPHGALPLCSIGANAPFLSAQVKSAMTNAFRTFDLIIFDSPALVHSGNSMVLVEASEFTLFILRSKHTKLRTFDYALGILRSLRTKQIVYVINDEARRELQIDGITC